MDQNAVVSFRHRQSPSSDRFLGVFSPPQNETGLGVGIDASVADNDELNEDDVFWTGRDFNEPQRNTHRQSFRQLEKSGILAALPEDHLKIDLPVVRRKPLFTSGTTSNSSSPTTATPLSRAFHSIPKPPSDNYNSGHSKSMPVRKFQHSAPMNVPMMPRRPQRNGELADIEIDDDDADDELLPPHEMVARGSMRSPKTTFSVLEGAGRTLKGRDLRQVRNAVWRQTGFQD